MTVEELQQQLEVAKNQIKVLTAERDAAKEMFNELSALQLQVRTNHRLLTGYHNELLVAKAEADKKIGELSDTSYLAKDATQE